MTPEITHLAKMLGDLLHKRKQELGFASSCVFVLAKPVKSAGADVLVFADGEFVTDPDSIQRLAQMVFLNVSEDAQNHLLKAQAARKKAKKK